MNIPVTKGAYQVSNNGRVRQNDRIASDGRHIKGRILKFFIVKPRGYLGVALRIDGVTVKFLVHRLVYCTFNNVDIYTNLDIDHFDNDPTNNFLENLSLMTRSENLQKGNLMRKLNPDYIVPRVETVQKIKPADANKKAIEQYSLDGSFIAEYDSLVQAERITGISRNNISRALRGVFKNSGGYIWIYKK